MNLLSDNDSTRLESLTSQLLDAVLESFMRLQEVHRQNLT